MSVPPPASASSPFRFPLPLTHAYTQAPHTHVPHTHALRARAAILHAQLCVHTPPEKLLRQRARARPARPFTLTYSSRPGASAHPSARASPASGSGLLGGLAGPDFPCCPASPGAELPHQCPQLTPPELAAAPQARLTGPPLPPHIPGDTGRGVAPPALGHQGAYRTGQLATWAEGTLSISSPSERDVGERGRFSSLGKALTWFPKPVGPSSISCQREGIRRGSQGLRGGEGGNDSEKRRLGGRDRPGKGGHWEVGGKGFPFGKAAVGAVLRVSYTVVQILPGQLQVLEPLGGNISEVLGLKTPHLHTHTPRPRTRGS